MTTQEETADQGAKAIVAKSDFDCVIKTIDEYIDTKRSKLREEANSSEVQKMDIGGNKEEERDDIGEKEEMRYTVRLGCRKKTKKQCSIFQIWDSNQSGKNLV